MSNKFKYNVTKIDELYPIKRSKKPVEPIIKPLLTKARPIAATKLAYELIAQYGYDKVLKQCSSCYDWKSLSEYHKFYGGFLGLKSECKVCNIKQSMAGDPKRKYTKADFYEYRDLMRKGKIFEGHRQLKSFEILEAFDPVI